MHAADAHARALAYAGAFEHEWPDGRRFDLLLTPAWRQIGLGTIAASQAEGVYGDTNVLIVAADFGARTS